MAGSELDHDPQDDAARAAWLYYVGGRTQDEIAKTMGISRQRAQRLVSRAMAEGLIRVKIEHPIAKLMQIGADLRRTYGLKKVRVAPDIGLDGNLPSVAPFAARMIEEVLWSTEPKIIGFGTGRALRAAVEHVTPMNVARHKLVSLIGNIAPDGTASFYDVIMRLADITRAPHYPLPMPVLTETVAERDRYLALRAFSRVIDLAGQADVIFVGVGQMDESAPLMADGFMSADEWRAQKAAGAVGEIAGRAFDMNGNYLRNDISNRVTSVEVQAEDGRLVVGIAAGSRKIAAIRAALHGKLLNALVTDEVTALQLLATD